jgi:hypothetical protein
MDEQTTLAMRFRPLIKTTLDGSKDEPFHPTSWQWFVKHTRLYVLADIPNKGSVPLLPASQQENHPEDILDPISANVVTASAVLPANGTLPNPGYGLVFYDSQYEGGEPWSSVISNGDGVFAHVEAIPNTNQVNIEYTILWSYNAADFSNHGGDITTVEAVYDRDMDLLVRLAYSIHGCALETYRIANPLTIGFRNLAGLGPDFNAVTARAAMVAVHPEDVSVVESGYCDNEWNSSDAYVFLAQDPTSQLYEHVVIYAEDGSHEPWPNESGSILTTPSHSGNGVSFLPGSVSVVGTPDAPNKNDEPFLYFNGKFGDDPEGIIFHNSWFWPCGRPSNNYCIPRDRFADKDPYDPTAKLGWPPHPEKQHEGEVLYVAPKPEDDQAVSVINNTILPFPGLLAALSFVPKNGVLALSPGNYPTNTIITRPMQIAARGGSATIGR